MKKKLSGISQFYDGRSKGDVQSEVKVREAFLRTARNTLDNFGIDKYSVERIWGMVEMLEEYKNIEEEQEK